MRLVLSLIWRFDDDESSNGAFKDLHCGLSTIGHDAGSVNVMRIRDRLFAAGNALLFDRISAKLDEGSGVLAGTQYVASFRSAGS